MENILERAREILQQVSDFMKGDLKVMDFDLKIWMLFAAGGAIVLITLVLILLLSGRKRKAKKLKNTSSALENLHTEGEQEEPGDDSASALNGGIVSIGDGVTVDLEAAPPKIINELDPVTEDNPIGHPLPRTTYSILARMRYRDLGQEGQATVMEGSDVVIGRGEGSDVQIHTNPSDTNVSHHHGVIFVQNDLPYYRDESRNGTMMNNKKTLRKGEMIELPVGIPYSIQLGNHQIILFLRKL